MAVVRLRVPEKAAKGDIVSVRALIQHPMETGFRRDDAGKAIARQIIHTFSCRYDGAEVFRADFFPAISADPFLVFHFRATASGDVVLTWTDDSGEITTQTRRIEVA